MEIKNLEDAERVLRAARKAFATSMEQPHARGCGGGMENHNLGAMAVRFRGFPIYERAARDLLEALGVDLEEVESSNPAA